MGVGSDRWSLRSDITRSNQSLFDLFETLGIEFKNFEHQTAYTFDEMYEFTNKIPGAHNKNLLLHSPLRGLVMIVMLGHDKLDLKACYKTLETQSLHLQNPKLWKKFWASRQVQ